MKPAQFRVIADRMDIQNSQVTPITHDDPFRTEHGQQIRASGRIDHHDRDIHIRRLYSAILPVHRAAFVRPARRTQLMWIAANLDRLLSEVVWSWRGTGELRTL